MSVNMYVNQMCFCHPSVCPYFRMYYNSPGSYAMYVLYLFVRMSAYLSSFTAVCRSVHPSSISLCVCLSVCLFSVYQFVPLSVTIEKIKTKYSNLFSIFFLPYAAGPILEMHRPPKTNVMWKKVFQYLFI